MAKHRSFGGRMQLPSRERRSHRHPIPDHWDIRRLIHLQRVNSPRGMRGTIARLLQGRYHRDKLYNRVPVPILSTQSATLCCGFGADDSHSYSVLVGDQISFPAQGVQMLGSSGV